MSWKDEEIDKVFGEAAGMQSFEYRPEYFADIEKLLPVKKSKAPLTWWFTSSAFMLGLIVFLFLDVNTNELAIEKNTVSETEKIDMNTSVSTSKDNSNSINEASNNPVSTTINTTSNSKSTTNSLASTYSKKSTNRVSFNTKSVSKNSQTVDIRTKVITNTNTYLENSLLKSNDELITSSIVSPSVIDKLLNDENSEFTNTVISIDKSMNELYELAYLPIDFLQQNTLESNLITGDNLAKKYSIIKVYFEANGGLGQTWTTSSENKNTINASFGVASGITIPVSKFTLSAGLGFQYTKLNDLKIKERTKVYGFGSEIIENTYKFNSIYALSVPVSINYAYGRHSLSLGFNTSVNLFTSLLRTQTIDENESIYRKGIANVSLFNRIGLQPNLGYAYSVNENTQIGLRCAIQLMQPTQSDRFIGTKVKMPFETQFYLKRTINF